MQEGNCCSRKAPYSFLLFKEGIPGGGAKPLKWKTLPLDAGVALY